MNLLSGGNNWWLNERKKSGSHPESTQE